MENNSLKISSNAKTVLEKRYLVKDANGKVKEKPEDMFRRVAKNIAKADKLYNKSKSTKETEKKK